MATVKALFVIALCSLLHNSFASNIATFSDAKCEDSEDNINGPNGYPNGTCTRIDWKGSFKSFQVVDVDKGCGGKWY